MNRSLAALAVLLAALASAAALRADDAEEPRLSWNPFADSKVGDWCAAKVLGPDDAVLAVRTWTVEKVEDDTVSIQATIRQAESSKVDEKLLTFSRKEAPTLKTYLALDASWKISKVEKKAVTKPVGECESLTFQAGTEGRELEATAVVSKKVKGTGLVALSTKGAEKGYVIELVGHGSKDTVEWGVKAADVKLTTVVSTKARLQVAIAKANIAALKAACAMYETDTGRFPRRPGAVDEKNLFLNDGAYLYAALRCRPTVELGGGPNSPYIEWKPEQVAHATPRDEAAGPFDAFDFGMKNGKGGKLPAHRWLPALAEGEEDKLSEATFQRANLPGTKTALVFLDPWGNPLVYREWASVPEKLKEKAALPGVSRLTDDKEEAHTAVPHDKARFDIYSFGPNGINEQGEGDDVTSWSR